MFSRGDKRFFFGWALFVVLANIAIIMAVAYAIIWIVQELAQFDTPSQTFRILTDGWYG